MQLRKKPSLATTWQESTVSSSFKVMTHLIESDQMTLDDFKEAENELKNSRRRRIDGANRGKIDSQIAS
jgi:hypothetical protein